MKGNSLAWHLKNIPDSRLLNEFKEDCTNTHLHGLLSNKYVCTCIFCRCTIEFRPSVKYYIHHNPPQDIELHLQQTKGHRETGPLKRGGGVHGGVRRTFIVCLLKNPHFKASYLFAQGKSTQPTLILPFFTFSVVSFGSPQDLRKIYVLLTMLNVLLVC